MLVWKEGERLQQEIRFRCGKMVCHRSIFAWTLAGWFSGKSEMCLRMEAPKEGMRAHKSCFPMKVQSAEQCVLRAARSLRKKCCGRYPKSYGASFHM
jgi:hypothetical protein